MQHTDDNAQSGAIFEIESGNRFEFGENWTRFLAHFNEERLNEAIHSLIDLTGLSTMEGKSFLDIGCGSGLFSLAAYKLGATVVSFDFDPHSVACAQRLKQQFAIEDSRWRIMRGSVLDSDFMSALPSADIVYSWGVLHHTGQMWNAISEAASKVLSGGIFVIALYNDQGYLSARWRRVKRIYCSLPRFLRPIWVWAVILICEARWSFAKAIRLKNPLPFQGWRNYQVSRGMSAWHDWVDWVGGYPFEVARPDKVIMSLLPKGLIIEHILFNDGWGCNQMRFRKNKEN